MPTTILFQSPQGGTSISGGQTVTLTTLDVFNNKNLRITCKHVSGTGSVTMNVKLIHEAQGNNSNMLIASLDSVSVNSLQTVTRRYTDFLGRRLRIEISSPVTAGSFAETFIVIVLGDS